MIDVAKSWMGMVRAASVGVISEVRSFCLLPPRFLSALSLVLFARVCLCDAAIRAVEVSAGVAAAVRCRLDGLTGRGDSLMIDALCAFEVWYWG